ncbi:hypothetical protein [uncultured Cyclobacterium sp.]|uniref:DUF6970 domain-containing protein n=1 Tax=uncultured Cyclobacterium sp. TaxID=453820 RepID=UPI0030ED43F0|tara:strand:- start:34751 stop:35107 length:357 start_codon:yes stop_codon:yes gene_type:complete
MKNSIKIVAGLFLSSLAIMSCTDLELEKDVPNCIKQKIKKIQKEDVHNPPASVWEWKVESHTYYYITSNCCDQYNYLFDENCNVICAPDGGFSGTGDGNCPDFTAEIEKTLIWEDNRK